MSKFRFALGTLLLYTASSQAQTLRKECTRDRCVYYSRNERVFTTTRESDNRIILRFSDERRKPFKVEKERGSIRITQDRR